MAETASGVVVYVNDSSTPQRHENATKFWVEGEGLLYVGNDQVGKLAVYAPGSWRRAKLTGSAD